jgi:DNA-binding NtrC family response regulator
MARIPIIDDEVSTQRPLQILLERAGHEVRSAANGCEALRDILLPRRQAGTA